MKQTININKEDGKSIGEYNELEHKKILSKSSTKNISSDDKSMKRIITDSDQNKSQIKKPLNVIALNKMGGVGKSLSPNRAVSPLIATPVTQSAALQTISSTKTQIMNQSTSSTKSNTKLADKAFIDIKSKISSTSPKHYNNNK